MSKARLCREAGGDTGSAFMDWSAASVGVRRLVAEDFIPW